MNTKLTLLVLLLLTPLMLLAAPRQQPKAPPAKMPMLPLIPAKPIAKKKELLFADDFKSSEHDKRWHRVVDTFAFENGALKGTQTRDKDIPAEGKKPAVKAHAAVHGLEVPTRDSIVQATIQFDGATMIDIEFDDRQFTGSHYGHICRVQVKPTGVTLLDEREGSQSAAMQEYKKDPAKHKAEIAKLNAAHSVTFPGKYEQGKSYKMVVEIAGDQMRVSIDDKPVAYLKSPGIGHPTKSKIELGVAGKSGYFKDIKVYNAEPVK